MKTSDTRRFVIRIILFVILSLYFLTVFGQADYNFKNAALQSGTALQTAAQYRFPDVKPGVDAIVTITNITGGISLTSIDDSTTGFKEAFQPSINIASGANGFIEFNIDFVRSGTITLMSQEAVPVTCLGVDGIKFSDGALYEQDQVEFINGFFDSKKTGVNLQLLNDQGWVSIKNITGNSYTGTDTANNEVMATVVNLNISSFKIRIGAKNTSLTKSAIKNKSVYFQKFNYPKSFLLPNRTLLSFNGAEKNYGIELKGTLSASHTYDKLVIERGSSATNLIQIAEININGSNSVEFPFTYFDPNPEKVFNFYRIRLINSTQNIYEVSNIMMVKIASGTQKNLQLLNTIVSRTSPFINLKSEQNTEMTVQLVNMSGRLLYSSSEKIYEGTNNIGLKGIYTEQGYYILILKTNNSAVSQKIIIQ